MLYLGVDLGGTNIKAALVDETEKFYRRPAPPPICPVRPRLSAMTSLCFAIS